MNFEQVANTHETTVTPKTSESLEYRKTTRHLGGILALVAALESTPAQAQAIEIEPTTSFETAVTTTLHENVLRGDNEIYAPFIKSEDNTIEQWLPIITGKTSEVEISPAEIAKQIVEAAEESGVNEVTFCNIHTHPLASALAHNDLTAEEVTAIQYFIASESKRRQSAHASHVRCCDA